MKDLRSGDWVLLLEGLRVAKFWSELPKGRVALTTLDNPNLVLAKRGRIIPICNTGDMDEEGAHGLQGVIRSMDVVSKNDHRIENRLYDRSTPLPTLRERAQRYLADAFVQSFFKEGTR